MDDNSITLKRPRGTAKAKPPQIQSTISHEVQGIIGEQLRAMYDHLKAEPVPDRLVELLRQLAKAQSGDRP
jgi:hypothetical protein